MNKDLDQKPWGVLLDVDGVMLDSYAAFQTVWNAWAEMHGLDAETVWAATHGLRPIDTIRQVAPALDPEKEFLWLRERVQKPDLAFPPIQGASDFLNSLPVDKWALVTSSYGPLVRERFQNADLPQPGHIVDAIAVEEGKPAPECYELGASLLEVETHQCLVIEDAPAGIRAGLDAGCTVVALASTHHESELSDAHEIVANLQEARQMIDTWLER